MESRKFVFLGSILLGCMSGVILYLCVTRGQERPTAEVPTAIREVSEPKSVSSPVLPSVGNEVSPSELPELPTLPDAPKEEKADEEESDWGDLPGLDSVGRMALPVEEVEEKEAETVAFSIEEPTFVMEIDAEVPAVLPDMDAEREIRVLPQEEIQQVSYEEPIVTAAPVKPSRAIRLGPPPRSEKKKSLSVK
ncbi:MAG: hypothetical protein Q4D98_05000 [Planctomycetia bacterium]|nr:hypothetical protein [Planctomycetia bacterium]